MKNTTDKLTDFMTTLVLFLTKHRITIFIILASVILSLMLIDITVLSDAEPTSQQVTDAEKSVKIIVFKKESIDVINSLKQNNTEINTLFAPNRYDPFNN